MEYLSHGQKAYSKKRLVPLEVQLYLNLDGTVTIADLAEEIVILAEKLGTYCKIKEIDGRRSDETWFYQLR